MNPRFLEGNAYIYNYLVSFKTGTTFLKAILPTLDGILHLSDFEIPKFSQRSRLTLRWEFLANRIRAFILRNLSATRFVV
jgi:hypothetical protein